jgi:hypothetical protein
VITVASVFKPGNGFHAGYVRRLAEGVAQHCKAPHRFVCLTNETLPVETISLIRGNRGWWNKLEIFRLPGPVVYFDLDTMIVGDITDIITHPHIFTTGENWGATSPAERVMGSAFMAWDGATDLSHLDVAITKDVDDKYSASKMRWGDQGYIQDHLGAGFDSIDDLFPRRFVSYKIHVRPQGRVPEGASIVAFHGRPRPAQVGWKLP